MKKLQKFYIVFYWPSIEHTGAYRKTPVGLLNHSFNPEAPILLIFLLEEIQTVNYEILLRLGNKETHQKVKEFRPLWLGKNGWILLEHIFISQVFFQSDFLFKDLQEKFNVLRKYYFKPKMSFSKQGGISY